MLTQMNKSVAIHNRYIYRCNMFRLKFIIYLCIGSFLDINDYNIHNKY
jgi:hypothetical protein